MQQNFTTAPIVGAATNMLSIFDKIEVRNEEKIAQIDRDFCEGQQRLLYATLDQLDVWYANFMKDAEQYKEEYKYSVTPEGRIEYRDPYRYSYDVETYKDLLFLPFKPINTIIEMRARAIQRFISSIISHFNKSYALSISAPEMDKKSLPANYRPVYMSYIDIVINLIWVVRVSARKRKMKSQGDCLLYTLMEGGRSLQSRNQRLSLFIISFHSAALTGNITKSINSIIVMHKT